MSKLALKKIFGIFPQKKIETDVIENITGAIGRYQVISILFLGISKIITALHQMAIIFMAPKVTYTCLDTNKATCPCSNPVYDRSMFTRTITMEWNLICERRYLTSLAQMLFQLGVMLGSIVFGMASDRYGRRPPILFVVVLQITSGLLGAFMPNYWLFILLRFSAGFALGGLMVVCYVLVMEISGTKYRDSITSLYHSLFNVGHILLPVFGYFFRDFSHFLLSISIPCMLMLSYFIVVTESPRWLVAVKKTDKAIALLEHIAKVNKLPTENIRADIEEYQKSLKDSHHQRGTIFDLFKTPNLRKNILGSAYNWLACSYCFYGVSQYVGHLSGNPFINVAAGASVTLLGTISTIGLLKIIGRKMLIIVFSFFCSFCLFSLVFLPEGNVSVVFASIGQVSSFIVFIVVYLHCSEMFPTIVRNAAVGLCSSTARMGAMIAPFVVDLKHVSHWIPPVAFGILPFISGCITFLLPETKGSELMTTLDQGEEFGKKKPRNLTLQVNDN